MADDPDLTAREMGASHQPLRLLADSRLRTLPDSRLGRSAKDHPVWVLHGPMAPEPARTTWSATGARLIETPTDGPHLNLVETFRLLAAEGLTRLLIEAGGQFAAALIRATQV